MNTPAKKPSRLVDGILLLGVLGLLAVAVLISGGGRAIAGQFTQQSDLASRETAAGCSPCEATRRAKEQRLKAEAVEQSAEQKKVEDDD